MTLVKFKRPNTLFPTIMDEFWKDFNDRETATYVPSVNVREEEDRYLLELSAPGFDKKDLTLSVEDELLTISGNVNEEKEERTDNYVSREFRAGSFKRSFNLGKLIDSEKIAAKYENGILNVTLPKVETAVRKPKEIKVA
jgi:HSP20 family protein